MNMQSFLNVMARMDSYFKTGRQTHTDVLDEYYDELNEIPEFVFAAICRDYRKNNKPSPGYFPTPNDLLKIWQEWQRQHPEKLALEYNRESCDYCAGTGKLFGWKIPDRLGYLARYIFRCGHCGNWSYALSSDVPMAKVQDLESKGYAVGELRPETPL